MGRWTTTAGAETIVGRRLQNSIIERSMDLAAFRACAALLKCGRHSGSQFVGGVALGGRDDVGDHAYQVAGRLPGNVG